MSGLDAIAERFLALDDDTRLELLADYSKRLSPLPEELRALAAQGENVVPECMTPVHIWLRRDNGAVHIHAGVPEEAPTVKGILSVIQQAYEGATAAELSALPQDLLERLGLTSRIRMTRTLGINAVIERIRREAKAMV